MESIQSGPYLFRLSLFADPDLSPANLGEAFNYYSAVPGWGWRAIAHRADGRWEVDRVVFGASLGEEDFALPDPEGEMESYFPCGRAVALSEGGVVYEGGIALPPRHLPGVGSRVGVWIGVHDADGAYGAELSCELQENDSWDGLEPAAVVARPRRSPGAALRLWSPAEEPRHRAAMPTPPYAEPPRADLPTAMTAQAERALALAREEARRLRREQPGSEELLLGLLREAEGSAAQVLREAGIELRDARAAVEFLRTGQLGPVATTTELPPRARKTLQLAGDEAKRAGDTHVDTTHLLLGLLRQNGPAADVLRWLGVSPTDLRAAVRRSAVERR